MELRSIQRQRRILKVQLCYILSADKVSIMAKNKEVYILYRCAYCKIQYRILIGTARPETTESIGSIERVRRWIRSSIDRNLINVEYRAAGCGTEQGKLDTNKKYFKIPLLPGHIDNNLENTEVRKFVKESCLRVIDSTDVDITDSMKLIVETV